MPQRYSGGGHVPLVHAASSSSNRRCRDDSVHDGIPAIGFRHETAGAGFSLSGAAVVPPKNAFSPCTPQQRVQRHNIHVLFLRSRDDDHVLNRLTAMIGQRVHKMQGFCHVEIAIPDLESSSGGGGQSYLSSSIYNGEAVTLTRTKTFANPGYTVLTFTVDGTELSRIADYLFESKRMELGFDAVGMYLAALPFQVCFFFHWMIVMHKGMD